MSAHKRFNEHAGVFLKRMRETFPDEPKIVTYKVKFDTISMVDFKKPVELFMENMIPYGEQILRKDEDFFKQSEHVNKAESISGKMGLVDHWDTLPIETKNTIWEYIQGLFMLGMGAMGYQEELERIIKLTHFKP